MLAVKLPDRLHISDYWLWEPGQKFALFEENLDEVTEFALRHNATVESLNARNIQIWGACKATGIRPSDVQKYFGGDLDHIRRSLKTGKATDQMLAYALSIAGLNPHDWLISPRTYHYSVGLARTVEAYRHHCVTTGTDLVKVSSRSALGMVPDESRMPALVLTPPLRALIFALCRDADILNKWIHLAIPVANDFSQLSNSVALTRFLTAIHDSAHASLAPEERESHDALHAWEPTKADPAVVLGNIALAWNPFQLFWHVVQDTVQH